MSNSNNINIKTTEPNNTKLPSDKTLQNAAKMSIIEDKPIMLDYWKCSLDKTAFIGQKVGTTEKFLIKNEEEYTSNIVKIYRVAEEFIIVTENSIYIVDSNIPMRKIETA